MSMPEQGSPLASDGEIVYIGLACLNWALSHIRRPVCPPTSKLPNSMPAVCRVSKGREDDNDEKTNRPSYQWMVTLFWTWLTTLTTTRSPSLAMMGGPGNCPFTLTMLFVWHSLVTFCNSIYEIFKRRLKKIITNQYSNHSTISLWPNKRKLCTLNL